MTAKPSELILDQDVVDVGHYWRVLRAHKLALVVGLLLGVGAGLVAANLRAPSFSSTASIVVQQVAANNPAGALNSDAGVNIATQAEIASSPAVAERVRAELGTDETARQLLRGLSVSVPNRSSVLSFTYTANSAATAQERAQTFAESYLAVRSDQAAAAVQDLVEAQQARIEDVRTRLAEAGAAVEAAADGSTAESEAQVQEQVLVQQLASLQVQLDQFSALIIEPGAVIADATLPSSDAGVTAAAFVASFAFLGLLLATAYAFLRDRSDKRIREAGDVTRALRIPVLAEFALGGTSHDEDVLATRLIVSARRDGLRTVVVAAASASGRGVAPATELAAAVAAAVATAAARRGVSVCLLEAGGGTAAAMLAEHGNQRSTDSAPISLVRLNEPAASVAPDRMATVLELARGKSQIVIIPAPPVLGSAETMLLASQCEGVVLVAERGTTTTDDLGTAVEHLQNIAADVMGVALVAPGRRGRRRGGPVVATPSSSTAHAATTTRSSSLVRGASPLTGSAAAPHGPDRADHVEEAQAPAGRRASP